MLTADAFLRSGKVRDLYALAGRPAAPGRVGSDQRVRRRPADRDPGQGSGPDRPVAVLVRGDRPGSSRTTCSTRTRDVRALRALAIAGDADASASTSARAGDDLPAGRGRAGRGGRPRLPGRLGLEGVPSTGTVCGIRLPAGLRESDRLPEPIFTPATKAEQGDHDENIDFDSMAALVGGATLAERVRAAALDLYRLRRRHRGSGPGSCSPTRSSSSAFAEERRPDPHR